MYIRIISGKYKSRRIKAPNNLPVRPTTDRAKEALFNILQNRYYIPELNILDLFTGTGNIAYEFGSRGAKGILAIDKHFGATRFVHQTAKEFDLPIKVYKKDVLKFLSTTGIKFDLIFADPPYDMEIELQHKMIDLVFDRNLLNDNGVFILEHIDKIDFSEHSHFDFARKYGLSVFSFFK